MRARSFACHDALWDRVREEAERQSRDTGGDVSISRVVRDALHQAYDPEGKLRAFQDGA